MAAPSDNANDCTLCDRVGLKPFTAENIFNYYIPLHGVVSYGALAINVMNPNIVSRLLPKKDMTNVLLMSTLVGTSCYVYGRPHLKATPGSQRIFFALLGGTLFSFGSVLTWAVFKSGLPKDSAFLSTLVALATGAAIVKVSSDYFDECDKLVEKK